jgi:DNA-binding MarR family transcriptional regulator
VAQRRQSLDALEGRPGSALRRAATALHLAMEEAVRPHGLSVAGYTCLEVLARRPGASAAELARAASTSRQAAHGVVRRLVEDGLLERAPSRAGRPAALTLTEAGERRRRAAAAGVDRVERAIAGALPPGGPQALVVLLQQVTTALPGGGASG